jgi:uncharacterized protein YecT (DUF1311 family)
MFSRFSLTEGRLVSRATKVIIICFAVLWNGQLLAATDDDLSKEYSECMDKSGGVTGEMLACNDAEIRRQDALLNANYKKLMSKLSGARQKALLKAQRAWLKFREAHCDFVGSGESTAAILGYSSCLLTMTAERAKELPDHMPPEGARQFFAVRRTTPAPATRTAPP